MKRLIPCVLTLCALPALSQAQTTLLSENFNELTPATGVTSAGPFSTEFGTTVNIVSGASCYGPASGVCIDLGHATLASNTMFMLVPDTTYTLSYDLLGPTSGTTNVIAVAALGPYSQSFTLTPGNATDGVVTTSFTVTTATDSSLVFASIPLSFAAGAPGAILDNVKLTATPVSVPEPASLALLAFGLAGAFTARRRR
jgi:hypothetical protein